MGETRPSALERLREEITVLRIEGTLFCFDPKEAKRATISYSDNFRRDRNQPWTH